MVEMIRKLAKFVRIKELYFESAEAQRLLHGQQPKQADVDLTYTGDGRFRAGGLLDVVASFAVRVRGIEKAPIAKIDCRIRLIYQFDERVLRKDIKMSDALASAFAETNGVYNAWPYFREYLQTTTGRLGIAPVIVPLLMANDLFAKLQEEELRSPSATKPALSVVKHQAG